MEGKAATPIKYELPEQSPDGLVFQNLPEHTVNTPELLEEKVAKLSITEAKKMFVLARHEVEPVDEKQLNNTDWIDDEQDDRKVAIHELGHRYGALDACWHVHRTTVIPGADYRGLNEASPNGSFDDPKTLKQAIRIALCGYIAYEVMNIASPKQGAGSDISKAEEIGIHLAYADFVARQVPFKRHELHAAGRAIVADQEREARSVLASRAGDLERESYRLAVKKTF